jgi:hypothetical protein
MKLNSHRSLWFRAEFSDAKNTLAMYFIKQLLRKSFEMKSTLEYVPSVLSFVVAPGLKGQTTAHFAHASVGPVQVSRFHLTLPAQLRASSSDVRITGFPGGPTQLPYPLVPTRISCL